MNKARDSMEVTTNMLVGAGINWTLTVIWFGVLSVPADYTGCLRFTIICLCVSFSRSYLIRRWFRKGE